MLTIDETAGRVTVQTADGVVSVHGLDTPEAFDAVSAAWLRCGWDTKYVYGFTWMGRPIIQLPEDMIRVQEVIYQLRPDVIIETGVAHGGSLVFYAGLCAAMGHGRVIGIDIELRSHNRAAIEAHPMAPRISLFEGSSIAPGIAADIRSAIAPGERVMVILDSKHTQAHVEAELALYAPLVSPGSCLVVCDGIMAKLPGAPRSAPDWNWNNPLSAIGTFLADHPDFVAWEPDFPFNEGQVRQRVTYWPNGFLRRLP